jgi:hypothetical protein
LNRSLYRAHFVRPNLGMSHIPREG